MSPAIALGLLAALGVGVYALTASAKGRDEERGTLYGDVPDEFSFQGLDILAQAADLCPQLATGEGEPPGLIEQCGERWVAELEAGLDPGAAYLRLRECLIDALRPICPDVVPGP